MIFFLLNSAYCDNPVLSEIYKLTNIYAKYLDQSTLITFLICLSAIFLLFVGRMTKRISLGYIISILIFHYIEKIQYLDFSTLFEPLKSVMEKIRNFLINTSHSYITVLLISLALSLIIVYLIGALRLFLGLAATYLFYTSYLDLFIDINDDYQLYVFYASIVIFFIILYILFDKAVNVVLMLLFSVTGSLLLFVTIEKCLNFNWGLSQIIITVQKDWLRKGISYTTSLFILITVCGIYVQSFFIPSLDKL